MKSLTDAFTLINGCEIPCVGFGTWRVQGGETAVNAVSKALQAGYRHIDTAVYYKNEDSVGEAVRKCGIAREEVFITSKVWDRGYKEALSSFDRALNKLQMDYIDLYLIHWPANAKVYKNWQEVNAGTWQALVEMYKKGRAKAIGVSNFLPHHLEPLMGFDVVPMVNQIEYHPGYMQKETVDYCREKNIVVEAWSPLGSGRVLSHPKLMEIAQKYGKSVAQICIRWCLQNGTLPLPRSVTPGRIEENAKVFDFEISPEDMRAINDIEREEGFYGWSGLHPDEIGF